MVFRAFPVPHRDIQDPAEYKDFSSMMDLCQWLFDKKSYHLQEMTMPVVAAGNQIVVQTRIVRLVGNDFRVIPVFSARGCDLLETDCVEEAALWMAQIDKDAYDYKIFDVFGTPVCTEREVICGGVRMASEFARMKEGVYFLGGHPIWKNRSRLDGTRYHYNWGLVMPDCVAEEVEKAEEYERRMYDQ